MPPRHSRQALTRGGFGPFGPVRDLAVVIPTLDEAADIGPCLASVRHGSGPVVQVIVADADSTDQTRDIARAMGATVLHAPLGRGRQICKGVEVAAADAVLVLHADCRLDPGMAQRVVDNLNQRPDAAGGAMGMRFDSASLGARCVAVLNALRTRLTGISFGDQGQFFRREALAHVGGFPDMLLMEDVECALRLGRAGARLYLPTGITASHRGWEQRGLGRGMSLVLRLFTRYLVERRLGRHDPSGRRYYERYYGGGAANRR